jgi:hypothetical protein
MLALLSDARLPLAVPHCSPRNINGRRAHRELILEAMTRAATTCS